MGIDLGIVIFYFVIINLIGMKYSASRSFGGYFLGDRSIPWMISCFSIVATETSTLTFISIPGLSYNSGMGFLQVAFGYLVGRVFVALILIPKYFEGKFETVYEFLQARFNVFSRRVVSVIFHITRFLADSVRLFATAIPLSIITGWDYRISVIVIGIATFLYTYFGGLRSIVVVDSIQLFLYIGCAIFGMILISRYTSLSFLSIFQQISRDGLKIVSSGLEDGFYSLFGTYNIFSGIIGGAFLSFASHGTDHLIVQRVLACRDENSAKKAMIFSGIIVIFQFMLFLLFGLFIKLFLNGIGFERSDEIVPYFIVHHLPVGVRGIMLAGIFAAAMSTLSSSINSLSSSTSADILQINIRKITEKRKVALSRYISLAWTVIIVTISCILKNTKSPLVEIGLSIASVTYGGMMGIFLMGRFLRDFSDKAAICGMIISIIVNILVMSFTGIFWLWYVCIGAIVSFVCGVIINSIFKRVVGTRLQKG